MLTRFQVSHYALLDEISIDFRPGLNILTGETGAGKSILLGALGLILGNRATSDMIRTGEDSALVEAQFELPAELLPGFMPDAQELSPEDGTVIVRREISGDGRNRCSVNGRMVNVSTLKRLGNVLVDLHGQHEHQSLLDQQTHISFLDGYGDVGRLLSRVSCAYENFSARQDELKSLEVEIGAARERQELYRYQSEKLNEAEVRIGEDSELERELTVHVNAERLANTAGKIYEGLSQRDDAVLDQVAQIVRSLEEMAEIDPKLAGAVEAVRTAGFQLEDASYDLRQYQDQIEFNPSRLAEIQDRLELLKEFKRKFGGSLQDVCAYRDRIEQELQQIDSADERREELIQALEDARTDLSVLAIRLSKARAKAARKLEKRVVAELSELGMDKTRFHVRIENEISPDGTVNHEGSYYSADASGIDNVEFLMSSNSGEALKPLVSIASGGEISRIMLALKVILAEIDQVPTLVFDEVDIGIGGRIAESIGQKLKLLARSHQVMCITHLHQVACWGDTHFTVSKQEKGNRTSTRIEPLDDQGRVNEIARMLAGEEVDELALNHAREILKRSADGQTDESRVLEKEHS